jgi:hypothetical protein
MKNTTIKLLSLAFLGLLLGSCSNADVESRIARLEGRVAELEGSGTVRKSTPAIATPTATTASPTISEPDTKPEGPLPVFVFEKETHDFGKIKEGDIVEYEFVFTNTGNAPLIIASATGSCGCTVPDWPKEPIGIGEKGKIQVKFNSSKKPGLQNKTVTITGNTFPKQTKLNIKANVEAAPKTEQPS